MATSITIQSVTHGPDGSKAWAEASGQGKTFEDAADAATYAENLPEDELLRRLVMKRWLAHSADLSDDSSIEGKTFTLNTLDNSSIVEVTG